MSLATRNDEGPSIRRRDKRAEVFFLKGTPVFADAVEQWTKGNYSNCPFM